MAPTKQEIAKGQELFLIYWVPSALNIPKAQSVATELMFSKITTADVNGIWAASHLSQCISVCSQIYHTISFSNKHRKFSFSPKLIILTIFLLLFHQQTACSFIKLGNDKNSARHIAGI